MISDRSAAAEMRLPHVPLSAPDITQNEIDAVTRVLRTTRLSLGPELDGFEKALAKFHGVGEAVAVSSGTAGLHLALLTLGIGPGDEVILPSFTFIAVANAVLHVGATPVFADIDPVTLNLDAASVERGLSTRTRALVVVHTFGVPADMDELLSLAQKHSLMVIEDACEAIGAEFGDPARRVGSFGDLSVLGFYPNKQITTGEGGAVLARDPAHAGRLRLLRNQGRQAGAGWLDHAEPGFNYRLSELACALGRVQLGRIDEILALRRAAAKRYDELLAPIPGIQMPPLMLAGCSISWFVYVVRVPEETDRDCLHRTLARQGIATASYFPPIHLQPSWHNHPSASMRLPVTERVARRTLALPFFNRIGEEQQARVADALWKAVAGSLAGSELE